MEKKKLFMLSVVSKVLKYRKEDSIATTEEIIKQVFDSLKSRKDKKILAIATANYALNFIERKQKASDKEIMQYIVDNLDKILDSVN